MRRILWSAWRRSATMGVLKSVEPTGFLVFAPAFAGTIWADVNRRIIQNCPHGRGRSMSSPPVWFRLCRLREDALVACEASAANPLQDTGVARLPGAIVAVDDCHPCFIKGQPLAGGERVDVLY